MFVHSFKNLLVRKSRQWHGQARETLTLCQKFYAFDSQHHQYAFIGDSNANVPNLPDFRDYFCWSIPGCPVNEIWLKRYLSFLSSRTEIIYWCCSSELNNIRILDRLRSRLHEPPQKRFWPYLSWQRYCYKTKYYLTIDREERKLLLQNYLEMVDWILKTYPNVILVPQLVLALRGTLPDSLNVPSTYDCLRERYPKRIGGFETLDASEKWWIDEIGHLNVDGYRSLARRLTEERSRHRQAILTNKER